MATKEEVEKWWNDQTPQAQAEAIEAYNKTCLKVPGFYGICPFDKFKAKLYKASNLPEKKLNSWKYRQFEKVGKRLLKDEDERG